MHSNSTHLEHFSRANGSIVRSAQHETSLEREPIIDAKIQSFGSSRPAYNDSTSRTSSQRVTLYGSLNEQGDNQGARHHATIQVSDELIAKIYGYKWSKRKQVFTVLLTILSLGLLRLFMSWSHELYLRCLCIKCKLADAELIFIRNSHNQTEIASMRTVSSTDHKAAHRYVGPLETLSQSSCTPLLPHNCKLLLPLDDGKFLNMDEIRYFTYRKLTYVFYPISNSFRPIDCLDGPIPLDNFHEWANERDGLSSTQALSLLFVYGQNSMDLQLTPILTVLIREFLSPFYVFQAFSIVLWLYDDYALYALLLLAFSAFSIGLDVYRTRKQECAMRSMTKTNDLTLVVRDCKIERIDSRMLVAGDLVHLQSCVNGPCELHFDAVLLSGVCVVDESILTGESLPQTKTSLPHDHAQTYSAAKHGRHTLYAGTSLLQTRPFQGRPIEVMVIRTGFASVKGQLVRSILYPKPIDHRFSRSLMRLVLALCCIATIGLLYTVYSFCSYGAPWSVIVVRALEIITVVVPPILPAAMTIGIMAAQSRLKKERIFCVCPSTIVTAGQVDVAVMDKTGTLTQQGLNFHAALAAHDSRFLPQYKHLEWRRYPGDGALVKAVVACQSLVLINGKLSGDPLELELFQKSQWILSEPTDEDRKFEQHLSFTVSAPKRFTDVDTPAVLGVVRQLPFVSELQRMSVIVRQLGRTNLMVYCKGAPETIVTLCKLSSVPGDWKKDVDRFSSKGYRLLAVAAKSLANTSTLEAQHLGREQIEDELFFLGLLVMKNELKLQSTPTIDHLQSANIRTVMCTGDNIRTAVSIAHECHILHNNLVHLIEYNAQTDCINMKEMQLDLPMSDGRESRLSAQCISHVPSSSNHSTTEASQSLNMSRPLKTDREESSDVQFAMSGEVFAMLIAQFPRATVNQLICQCNVFARMSPEQKATLIERLQQVGYIVAMCGDGANDCAALKTAHVGISLSAAAASVASPFTSEQCNIGSVPIVIGEGRAALVSSLSVIMFIAMYSMMEFTTVCMLYGLTSDLTPNQFLFIDLCLIAAPAFCLGYQGRSARLHPTPPPNRILSTQTLVFLLSQIAILFIFNLFVFMFTQWQPWYNLPIRDSQLDSSFIGTALFNATLLPYLSMGIITIHGLPHRQPIVDNYPWCVSLLVGVTLSLIVILYPPESIIEFLGLARVPFNSYQVLLLVLSLLCCVTMYLCDHYLIHTLLRDTQNQSPQKLLDRLMGKDLLDEKDQPVYCRLRAQTRYMQSVDWLGYELDRANKFARRVLSVS